MIVLLKLLKASLNCLGQSWQRRRKLGDARLHFVLHVLVYW